MHDTDRQVRESLAGNPACPTDALLALLRDSHWHVRWRAAQNVSADQEVHLAALSTGDRDLVWAVGQLGDRLQPEVVDSLLRHPVRAGREQLALSTSSPALLHELAQDADHRVRLHVAMSDACPLALLRTLADDPRKEVRQVVAASPRLPRDVVDKLVLDRSADVRWNVVSTWEHDIEVCRALVDDSDDIVRTHARVALGMPV
ncbi:hypothetical protein [Cellulomonas septica]|uniref:Uncharacterized protein n=1 Tax=Cellulomonas septica TaxID=285080 RepID=A0ABX1JVT3_9CELL|nr:hypothetical protein [Cellulomonas septica]NKY38162.1 hypothetical protein [Cellulomonas septica]